MEALDHSWEHLHTHFLQEFRGIVRRRGFQVLVRKGWMLLLDRKVWKVGLDTASGTAAEELDIAVAVVPGLVASDAMVVARLGTAGAACGLVVDAV